MRCKVIDLKDSDLCPCLSYDCLRFGAKHLQGLFACQSGKTVEVLKFLLLEYWVNQRLIPNSTNRFPCISTKLKSCEVEGMIRDTTIGMRVIGLHPFTHVLRFKFCLLILRVRLSERTAVILRPTISRECVPAHQPGLISQSLSSTVRLFDQCLTIIPKQSEIDSLSVPAYRLSLRSRPALS